MQVQDMDRVDQLGLSFAYLDLKFCADVEGVHPDDEVTDENKVQPKSFLIALFFYINVARRYSKNLLCRFGALSASILEFFFQFLRFFYLVGIDFRLPFFSLVLNRTRFEAQHVVCTRALFQVRPFAVESWFSPAEVTDRNTDRHEKEKDSIMTTTE